MKCTQSRVCTLEEVLRMIREDLPQSVGIVLFGADGDFKKKVYSKCVEDIPNLVVNNENGSLSLQVVSRALGMRQSVLEVMDGYASAKHDERHQTALTLKNLGARTVVGIYAKVKYTPSLCKNQSLLDKYAQQLFDDQAYGLMQEPPTADGLDWYVEVEDKKEA